MEDKLKVALIGGGRTGTPLLEELLKYSYVEIIGVSDFDPAAEGLRIAAEKEIFTTSEPMALVKKGECIDILIEVSGDASLKKHIKEYFEQTGNVKTLIMHDLIARLFISVCTKQDKLISGLHPADVGVGG
ncbi:MAG: hypothetical protein WA140_11450 [Geobacteraceae bacterium]